MDRRDSVAGVVLAAGSSTRMGQNKLLLQIGGQSVLRRAVHTALAAGLDPVLVVVGFEAERTRSALLGIGCRVVENLRYGEGMASSIAAGIRALAEPVEAAVIHLADMPRVTEKHLRTLVDRFRATQAPAVASRYGNATAPPTAFEKALFPELLALRGDAGARAVLRRLGEDVGTVDFPEEDLLDLDVPRDLEKL